MGTSNECNPRFGDGCLNAAAGDSTAEVYEEKLASLDHPTLMLVAVGLIECRSEDGLACWARKLDELNEPAACLRAETEAEEFPDRD